MAKIPQLLYTRSIKNAAGDNVLETVKDLKDFKLKVDDKDKVGVYELKSMLEVKGVMETTEIGTSAND
jgi:hypothetical protein